MDTPTAAVLVARKPLSSMLVDDCRMSGSWLLRLHLWAEGSARQPAQATVRLAPDVVGIAWAGDADPAPG
jgi:hypothetical protein